MVNVLSAIYAALLGNSSITDLLGSWNSNSSLFTRRPVPVDSAYPMIIVNPPYAIVDDDGLVSRRSNIFVDVAVYGEKDEQYRDVDTIAFLIRNQFHRERTSISVSGYHIYEIVTTGPVPAPADDEEYIGRVVTLSIRIQPV